MSSPPAGAAAGKEVNVGAVRRRSWLCHRRSVASWCAAARNMA